MAVRRTTCAMPKIGIRVAVVDDDAAVRKALARLLCACAFDIKTYGSAREFIKAGLEDLPACLVLDLHMPDISGLDLQRQLRSAGINIPTVIVTAHNDPGLRERCQSVGASAFLLKPLNQETLVSAINAAIGNNSAQSDNYE
jgi:FixJ family two-component response regulator